MEAVLSQPSSVEPEAKKSSFGIASLVFALVTVVSPVVVALVTGYELSHNEEANNHGGWGGFLFIVLGVMAAVFVAGVSSLIGTLTGVVALLRGEAQQWRPVVGLVVNVPVTLFVLYLIVAMRANNGG